METQITQGVTNSDPFTLSTSPGKPIEDPENGVCISIDKHSVMRGSEAGLQFFLPAWEAKSLTGTNIRAKLPKTFRRTVRKFHFVPSAVHIKSEAENVFNSVQQYDDLVHDYMQTMIGIVWETMNYADPETFRFLVVKGLNLQQ